MGGVGGGVTMVRACAAFCCLNKSEHIATQLNSL